MIPENIAKEHIEKAIKEIDEKGIGKDRHSATYDIEFNGNLYPPKLVISIANRFANGEELDTNSFNDGEGTDAFKLLKRWGFNIIPKKNKTMFSWVETHKELAQHLLTKENNQLELTNLLKSVGVSGFKDGEENGKKIELSEIDPFTFFFFIYKYGGKRRLAILQKIAQKLNLTVPIDDNGIPSVQPLKVCLFPFKEFRTNNEIERLWNFFKNTLKNSVTDEDFKDVLTINSTGKTKLTEGMFDVDPENYFPVNGPTKPYLKEVLDIDPTFNTYSEYKDILRKIKEKSEKPFYELSYDAWKWNDDRKKTNYWVFQGNPDVFDSKTALEQNIVDDWIVTAHKNKIKIGDKVILWITGKEPGCYAFAEITSEPYEKSVSKDDHLWKKENKNELKVDIKITHNLVSQPITKDQIDEVEELKDLKVGNKGINFSATKKQFSKLSDLITSNIYDFENTKEHIKPKNQILYGPPGTGKTYNMVNYALSIINGKNNDNKKPGDYDTDSKEVRIGFENEFRKLMEEEGGDGKNVKKIYFVTFHQSYSYEDFVLGIAPDLSNVHFLKFKRKKGIFYVACEKALDNPDKNFVIIIDEINRANISRVFGELITLIEKDKRISDNPNKGMRLMLPNAPLAEDDPEDQWKFARNFGVPENLYMLGTMNTADKSIASLDIALRRRFRFIPKYPNSSLVKDEKLRAVMLAINSRIIKPEGNYERGADFTLGHSYFMDKSIVDLPEIMDHSIIPLLLEYYMNDFQKVQDLLNKCLEDKGYSVEKNENDGTLSLLNIKSADIE